MNPNTPSLNDWLQENYELHTKDLNLRIPQITDNIVRYSKEGAPKTAVNFNEIMAQLSEEFHQHIQEEKTGKLRKGLDPYLMESIQATRERLEQLGEQIILQDFLLSEFLESVKPFVVRALQKEIGRAIQKVKELNVVDAGLIYANKELAKVLMQELEQ